MTCRLRSAWKACRDLRKKNSNQEKCYEHFIFLRKYFQKNRQENKLDHLFIVNKNLYIIFMRIHFAGAPNAHAHATGTAAGSSARLSADTAGLLQASNRETAQARGSGSSQLLPCRIGGPLEACQDEAPLVPTDSTCGHHCPHLAGLSRTRLAGPCLPPPPVGKGPSPRAASWRVLGALWAPGKQPGVRMSTPEEQHPPVVPSRQLAHLQDEPHR